MTKNKPDLRYICPKCLREFKTHGWYRRHSINKHQFYFPYIPKEIVERGSIDSILGKIDNIEKILSKMAHGVVLKHDIDIKPLRPDVKQSINKSQLSFKACITELKQVFNQGLTLLSKMDDMEVGIKSQEELEALELEAIKRSKNTNI